MAVSNLAHIDEHQLTILHHNIFCLQVKVEQLVTCWNAVENAKHHADAFFREITANMFNLLTFVLHGRWYVPALGNLYLVHLLEEVGIHPCTLINLFGMLLQVST